MSDEIMGGEPPEGEVWWYSRGEGSSGPVSAQALRDLLAQKVIDGSTLIWREEFGDQWQRFDATSIWSGPKAPPPLRIDASKDAETSKDGKPLSEKWLKDFEAVEALEDTWSLINQKGARRSMAERSRLVRRQFSLWGLIFGPFYYLYLGMWGRGWLLLSLIPVLILLQDLTGLALTAPLIGFLCAALVKRDYYRFRIKHERVWSFLRFSTNTRMDAFLAVGIAVICIGSEIALAESESSTPRTRLASEPRATQPAGLSDQLMAVKKPDFSNEGWTKLVLTSKVNRIQVFDLTVNRGSCRAVSYLPATLAFGEVTEITMPCNPLEVEIATNLGKGSFKWPR